MRLFDFSLLVGSDPCSGAEAPADALARYLDARDAGGIVTSLAGAYYDYEAGNRETFEVAGRDGRLLAGFAIDPRRTSSAEVDFDEAAKYFRAAVLFQNVQAGLAQGWPLEHPAVSGICKRAGAAGLPIIIYVGRAGGVAGLVGVAGEVQVPVIALGVGYGATNEVVAGAGAAENLYFGCTHFAGLDNIEVLTRELGAERLVYASGEPRFSHEGSLALLRKAEISEEARGLIEAGNARRIFGEAR